MQKMTSITPSIYEIIHSKVFFKFFAFYQFQGFRQAYKRPGPLTAILSICDQRFLTNYEINLELDNTNVTPVILLHKQMEQHTGVCIYKS